MNKIGILSTILLLVLGLSVFAYVDYGEGSTQQYGSQGTYLGGAEGKFKGYYVLGSGMTALTGNVVYSFSDKKIVARPAKTIAVKAVPATPATPAVQNKVTVSTTKIEKIPTGQIQPTLAWRYPCIYVSKFGDGFGGNVKSDLTGKTPGEICQERTPQGIGDNKFLVPISTNVLTTKYYFTSNCPTPGWIKAQWYTSTQYTYEPRTNTPFGVVKSTCSYDDITGMNYTQYAEDIGVLCCESIPNQ